MLRTTPQLAIGRYPIATVLDDRIPERPELACGSYVRVITVDFLHSFRGQISPNTPYSRQTPYTSPRHHRPVTTPSTTRTRVIGLASSPPNDRGGIKTKQRTCVIASTKGKGNRRDCSISPASSQISGANAFAASMNGDRSVWDIFSSPAYERRPCGQASFGRLSAHGCACSKAAAACSTPRSSKRRPTICRPTGRPSAVKPHGTLAAGFQDMLNG